MDVSQLAIHVAEAIKWLWPGVLLGLLSVPSCINSRRPAVSTIAWILALVLLPYLGIALYLALGHTRMTRRVRKRRRARSEVASGLVGIRDRVSRHRVMDATEVRSLNPLTQSLLMQANAMRAHPLTLGNRSKILVDGDGKFPALLAAIASAKDHIHLEYYIFQRDETGERVRDALVVKAKEGVEVRILVDAVGSLSVIAGFFGELEAAGGRVVRFMPARFTGRRLDLNFRNHRKIAVIDGKIGFTGGMNIGNDYSGFGAKSAGGGWHDIHFEVEGAAVHSLQETFSEDWFFAAKEDLANRRYFPEPRLPGDDLVQVVTSGPDTEWPALHHLFFAAIAQAKKRVWIVTPYFVPTESLLSAMTTAAHRGVDVRIVLPQKIDHMLVYLAARSYYEELLKAGVRIFEYNPRMLHAKVMAVDGLFGTIGSCNMDVRSFYLNFEINVLIYSTRLARELEGIIRSDLRESEEVHLSTFVRRPYHQRLAENSCRLLSPLL